MVLWWSLRMVGREGREGKRGGEGKGEEGGNDDCTEAPVRLSLLRATSASALCCPTSLLSSSSRHFPAGDAVRGEAKPSLLPSSLLIPSLPPSLPPTLLLLRLLLLPCHPRQGRRKEEGKEEEGEGEGLRLPCIDLVSLCLVAEEEEGGREGGREGERKGSSSPPPLR